MGRRRRTTANELLARAKANSYERGYTKEQFGANHDAVITAADELARASMGHGQSTMESSNSESMGIEALKEAEQLWMDNVAYYGEKIRRRV
jgi:hypothetical protein